MASPMKPWESPSLQNASHFMRSQNSGTILPTGRTAPVLPPRPMSAGVNSYAPVNSYNGPYSFSGGYNAPYGSYGSPYRNSMYGSHGSYGGYNSYSMFDTPHFSRDDHERRFIQYAEESSRHTFASVESVVRAFNSLAMMLDNTFFAMTSSFRAILGVAENFGKLRTMFGHIWYSVNIFRFFTWLYRKFRQMLGLKVSHSVTSLAWKEAAHGSAAGGTPPGSSWPTLAFLGVIVSAPYIISKFLPKYEDKQDPANWQVPGIKAKACFDFIASSPNELTIHTNDNILLAPTYVQEEMNLRNTGWAYAVHNGRTGVIPLNYIVINKSSSLSFEKVPVPRKTNSKENGSTTLKTNTKRVSFGDIQVFESDDYPIYKEDLTVKNTKKDTSCKEVNQTEVNAN